MAKVQVYLPDALHRKVRARLRDINISAVLQEALEEKLAARDRHRAMDALIRDHEREFGKITQAEADAVLAADRASARRPNAPRRSKKRAA